MIYLNIKLITKCGNTALIAGASEGIGAAFAEELAANRFSLVLTARRMNPLKIPAGKLSDRYKVVTRCHAIDLSD